MIVDGLKGEGGGGGGMVYLIVLWDKKNDTRY